MGQNCTQCKCDGDVSKTVGAAKAGTLAYEEEVIYGTEETRSSHSQEALHELCFFLENGKSFETVFSAARGRSGQNGQQLVVWTVNHCSPLKTTMDGRLGLCAGDTIVEVNGERGDAEALLAVLREFKSEGGTVRIKVRPRPDTFEVVIKRDSEESETKMGFMCVTDEDHPDIVEMRTVSAKGAIHSWNERSYPLLVAPGDWVTSVNGKSYTSNEYVPTMQEIWRAGETLTLGILTKPTSQERMALTLSDGV